MLLIFEVAIFPDVMPHSLVETVITEVSPAS